MNFYEIMDSGRTIAVIDPARNYDPALFWISRPCDEYSEEYCRVHGINDIDEYMVFEQAPSIGKSFRSFTKDLFDWHIIDMIGKGFTIEITTIDPRNASPKHIYEKLTRRWMKKEI